MAVQDKMFIADTTDDLLTLDNCDMGSTCYVIETGETYIANSKSIWFKMGGV
jgi:hypothetical protein